MRLAPGPFFAAAGVQTDKTAEALREFFNQIIPDDRDPEMVEAKAAEESAPARAARTPPEK